MKRAAPLNQSASESSTKQEQHNTYELSEARPVVKSERPEVQRCEACGQALQRQPRGVSKAAVAYQLYGAGVAWHEIAQRLSWSSGGGARTSAMRHAVAFELPWPPDRSGAAPKEVLKAERKAEQQLELPLDLPPQD